MGFGTIVRREIHAFSDASEDAIGAAVYLRQVNDRGENRTALVFGQSRVAPIQITSIPRLELCAAVLAARAVDKIMKEMDVEIDEATFYTDSKVVLGYIQNESRRFCLCRKPRPANSQDFKSRAVDLRRHKRKPRRPSYTSYECTEPC